MMKFATIMANCIENNLGKFCKKNIELYSCMVLVTPTSKSNTQFEVQTSFLMYVFQPADCRAYSLKSADVVSSPYVAVLSQSSRSPALGCGYL